MTSPSMKGDKCHSVRGSNAAEAELKRERQNKTKHGGHGFKFMQHYSALCIFGLIH